MGNSQYCCNYKDLDGYHQEYSDGEAPGIAKNRSDMGRPKSSARSRGSNRRR